MSQKFAPISVVFPALNEEKNIGHCLDALLNQTVRPKQVIVVNHNSTDTTEKIAQSYELKFKKQNIEYIILTETKKGIANARNLGFNTATQQIIASTDPDCIQEKDWIQSIDTFFQRNNVVACAGKLVYHDSPKIVEIAANNGYYALLYKFVKFINGFHPLSTGNCAIKKDAFIKVGGFNQKITSINGLDDMELASRLSKVGTILYNKDMVVATSFRRYTNLKKAVTSLYQRHIAWQKIRENFKN